MIVLSVCNHKGGTGKTTTVIHLAAALGLSGWNTLVIDLDPQGFLSRTMNVGEPPVEESVAALFGPEGDLDAIGVREVSGFDLIPSSSTLTRKMRRLNKPTDVLWAREALREVDQKYDFLLFDTAAAVTVYSLNALVASSHVLIPILPEYQSVVGGEQTFRTAQLVQEKLNPSLRSPLLLFTQVDGRKRTHRAYREYLRDKYQSKVLDTVIRTSTSLAESRDGGTTVFDHDPGARGARDYAAATDDLIGRIRTSDDENRAPESRSRSWEGPARGTGDIPAPNEVLST